MTIVGQLDHLRHVVKDRTDDPRVVVTRCDKRMAFSGRRASVPVKECPGCYWRKS